MTKFLLKCLTLCLFPLLARITGIILGNYSPCQNRAITECLEIKIASAVNQICRFALTKSSRNLTVACHRHPTEKMILCNFLTICFVHYKLCAKIYLFCSSQSALAL